MEGVIAREREINWSEVHFHFAFKTRRHATQFGLSVGFLCMCLYLGIWVWTKAWVYYDCARICQCVHASWPSCWSPQVSLYSTDLKTSFYTVIILSPCAYSISLLISDKSHDISWHECVFMVCEVARRREISGGRLCVCVSNLVCLTFCFTVGLFTYRECFSPLFCLDVV